MAEFTFNGEDCFRRFLAELVDKNVYDKQETALPFEPERTFTLIDFFPGKTPGEQVDIFIDGTLTASALVVDATGLIYADMVLSKLGVFALEIKDTGGGILRKDHFTTLNLHLYLDIFGLELCGTREDLEKTLTDLDMTKVQEDRAFPVYGFLYDFRRPFYFDFTQYNDILFGSSIDKGIKTAYRNQSTDQGVRDLVTAFQEAAGLNPLVPVEIFHLKNKVPGWLLFEDVKFALQNPALPHNLITNPIIDSDPGVDHYHIFDPANAVATIAKPTIILQSSERCANTIKLDITGIEFDVVREPLIRLADFESGDDLTNRYINPLIPVAVVDEAGNPYIQDTDFVVAFTDGEIIWFIDNGFGGNLLSGTQPANNSTYFATYNFMPIDLFLSVLRRIKPAHIGCDICWFDKFGNVFQPCMAQWDISTYDDFCSIWNA